MEYTIKQMAEKVDLTSYTLRYYEKEGLLPFINRDEHGHRVFDEEDIEWVMLICCLRDTGMSLAEIKRYIDLCMEGDETIEIRREIILSHKQSLENKIDQMKKHLNKINTKLQYYDNLVQGQGADICNPNYKKTNI